MRPGELVRTLRRRHGLSQRALALRAGTTQPWVSAIERGTGEPTVEMVSRLLLVMGYALRLEHTRLSGDADHDPIAHAHALAQSPSDRVTDALAWMADLQLS